MKSQGAPAPRTRSSHSFAERLSCGIGRRQRVDDTHLIGDSGGVDHFADVAMKAFERSLWRFGIERTRRHIMCSEIIEQSARDGGLADASLVRAD